MSVLKSVVSVRQSGTCWQELVYGDIYIVKRVTLRRLRWLGHVVCMERTATAKKEFEMVIGGRPRRGGLVSRESTKLKTTWLLMTYESGKDMRETEIPGAPLLDRFGRL